MALRPSHLVALVAAGLLMILIGMPWWMGIGVILISMAMAVSGDEPKAVQRMPGQIKQFAVAGPASIKAVENKAEKAPPKPWWVVEAEKEPKGSVNDPMIFRPSFPADGFAGLKGYASDGPLAVGPRVGTVSFYPTGTDDKIARVRIKEDLRLNMPFMNESDINGIKPLTNLLTCHFRTNKPIINTKPIEDPTFDALDKELFDNPDWADPGDY